VADALDDAFGDPAPPVALKKLLPRQLMYYCALGEHKRCGLYGLVNTGEGRTGTNAGVSHRVRCSCECHRDQFDV
jgi:hypothetical protein